MTLKFELIMYRNFKCKVCADLKLIAMILVSTMDLLSTVAFVESGTVEVLITTIWSKTGQNKRNLFVGSEI